MSYYGEEATITGNVSISSNLNVGTLRINSGTITDTSGVLDFGGDNVLTTGNIGINTNAPSVSLDIDTTDAVKLPSGTTAERPTPENGMIRYNEDDNEFEGYKNGSWDSIGAASDASFQFTQVSAVSTIVLTQDVPTAISPLSVSITPKSTSSVIRIDSQIFGEFTNYFSVHNHTILLGRSINGGAITYLRNPTGTFSGISALTLTYSKEDDDTTAEVGHLLYYDQPNTTLSTTYTLYIQSAETNPEFVLNRCVNSGTGSGVEYGMSNISASDGAGVASGSNSSTSMDVTNDTSSNTDFRLIFTDGAGSNRILKCDTSLSGIKFNPSSSSLIGIENIGLTNSTNASSPIYPLDFGTYSSGASGAQVGKNIALYRDVNGDNFYGFGTNNDSTMEFHTGSAKAGHPLMKLKSGVGLGIGLGSSAPSVALDVNGEIRASGNIASYLDANNYMSLHYSGNLSRVYQGNSGSGLHFTISAILPMEYNGTLSNGFINLGGSSNRWSNIWCNAIYNSAGIISSDDRLKHNEEPVLNALSIINKLNVKLYDKTYNMLDADYMGELTDYEHFKEAGIIAQEVLEIPELKDFVTIPEDVEKETYGVNYNSIFSIGLKAIQELLVENETLKNEIELIKQHLNM